MRNETIDPFRGALRLGVACLLVALLAWVVRPGTAEAFGWGWGVCESTSHTLLSACKSEVSDDYLTARAVCLNLADSDERDECKTEAAEEAGEAWQECYAVREARNEVCEAVGSGPYDPGFDPEDFATAFDVPGSNPFQPLQVGNHWEYAGGDETIVIDILDETKSIEGVTCVTQRDEAFEEGAVTESTDDWIAQHLAGDTWYCGEISQNFELFEGDDPEVPELVDVEGSWKAGRDGAKPGILVPADAPLGFTYRQEYAVGDAEDVATVVSRTYGYGDDPELDELVPEELAELLCDDDCMVTRDSTPLEPGVYELKYYAPGIGLFLETNPEEEEIVQLVSCNFDARCDDLPEPEEEDE
jgi:hypothetical protein